MSDIMKQLQRPFPAKDIEWRVSRTVATRKGNKSIVLAYVTNRAIMERLDEVFGVAGWRNEYSEWRDKGVLCTISCNIDGQWISKSDGADATNFEATKGGFSASMKRAAVQWGIGRYLYNLTEQWVDIKENGQNYIKAKIKVNNKDQYVTGYWNTPQLPEWALPIGDKTESVAETHDEEEQEDRITPELIAQIKKEWINQGFKEKALNVQINKLYNVSLTDLTDEQGNEFLKRLTEKLTEKESA